MVKVKANIVPANEDVYVDVKGTNVIIQVEDCLSDISININVDVFSQIADTVRHEWGEKTYTELEDAYLLMQQRNEELENELEILREVNKELRRR